MEARPANWGPLGTDALRSRFLAVAPKDDESTRGSRQAAPWM